MFLYYIQIVLVSIIVFIAFFISFQSLVTHTYWKRKGVPFLETILVWGQARPIVYKEMGVGELAANIYKQLRKRNLDFGGYYIFHKPVFMPTDPELIKAMLIKDFKYFQDRGFYHNEKTDPLSAHLGNIKGEKWKRNRVKANPSFSTGNIKNMFEFLVKCSLELENIFDKPSQTQEPVDIRDIMSRLTTDFIATYAFGLECNSLKNPNDEFRKCGQMLVDNYFNNEVLVAFSLYLPEVMDFFKIPLTSNKVANFFMNVVQQTVDYREKNNVQRKDYLDLYIKMKHLTDGENGVSFNELAATLYIIYIGGFETTEASMTFGLYELCLNQEIQDKLREEILAVLKNFNGEICYDSIQEMKYMDRVIQEILRKYPPIPLLNRECVQDYHIPGTKHVLEKGVGTWISLVGLHKDPQYYPDPEKFDPNRFTEEEKAKRHPFTYMPFGEGPRMCIGKRLGLVQMKIGLSRLLKSYKFTLDPKTRVPIEMEAKGVFLSPKYKVWLQCTRVTDTVT